jgi:hypothetical protein
MPQVEAFPAVRSATACPTYFVRRDKNKHSLAPIPTQLRLQGEAKNTILEKLRLACHVADI